MSRPFDFEIGDVDQDGNEDIVVADYSTNKVHWFKHDGMGSFVDSVLSSEGSLLFTATMGDYDGDNDTDVLSGSYNDGAVTILKNNANTSFESFKIARYLEDPTRMATADFDNDGDQDVVLTAAADDEIIWLESNGNGAFKIDTVSSQLDGPFNIETVDLNQDGNVDILATSYIDDRLAWYENDGNKGFMYHLVDDGGIDKRMTADDLDSDGDLDLIAGASNFTPGINWYENDGSENFTTKSIGVLSHSVDYLEVGDIDMDGDMDIAYVGGNNIGWLQNDGSENFVDSNLNAVTYGASQVVLADYGNDNDLDMFFIAETNTVDLGMYENDGMGSFTLDTISMSLNRPKSIDVVDIDQDNDLDIALAEFSNDRFLWYEQDSGGSFVEHVVDSTLEENFNIIAADFDGDAYIDLAGIEETQVVLYTNSFCVGFDTISQDSTICSTESISFNGQTITTTGTYFDTLPAMVGCDTLVELNVTVLTAPVNAAEDTITQGDSVSFAGVFRKQSGTYYDTLSGQAANGCDSVLKLELVVEDTVSSLPAWSRTMKVYPNPSSGSIWVETEQPLQLSIWSAIGQLQGQRNMRIHAGRHHLDLENLSPGLYLFEWSDERSRVFRQKVLIE